MSFEHLLPGSIAAVALLGVWACDSPPTATPLAPDALSPSLQTIPGADPGIPGHGKPPDPGARLRLPATEIQPTDQMRFLLGTSKLNDLGFFLALLDLEIREPLVGEELVLLGLFFDDGELQGAELSEPFTGGGSLAGLLDPSLVPGDQFLPGDQLVPGDQFLPGDQFAPGAVFIPGDQFVPGDQFIPGDQFAPKLRGWPVTGIIDGIVDRGPDGGTLLPGVRDAVGDVPYVLLVAYQPGQPAYGDSPGPGIFVVFLEDG